jgi:hypothetical protein
MKGRNVIDGEKVERRSNQPSLPPNDSEGPLNARGPSCLTIWGVNTGVCEFYLLQYPWPRSLLGGSLWGVPYYVTEALELGFRYAFAISVAQVAMGGHPLGWLRGPIA